MSKKAFHVLLGDRIVGYHPILARIAGGAAEGVLLSQFLYWENKMQTARGSTWDGWFWKIASELYEETGMTRREFETARTNLIKRGFIEYEPRGVPMKAHYHLNIHKIADALESAEEFAKLHARKFLPKGQTAHSATVDTQTQGVVLQFVQNGHVENGHAENGHESLSEMDKQKCPEWTNRNVQSVQSIQEITALDSQENPKEEIAANAKPQIQILLKQTFHFAFDADWDWLDALLLEIPDPVFLESHIERTRALQPHTIFDRSTFIRNARIQYARSLRRGRNSPARVT